MKKVLSILLIIILMAGMLFGLTACGDDDDSDSSSRSKKVTYTEGMMNLRNFDPLILEGHSAGELLDIALKNADWKEDDKYNIDYAAVIVTGKDKKTGEKVKIVWNAEEESGTGFITMTIGDEEKGYSSFLSYLGEYIED